MVKKALIFLVITYKNIISPAMPKTCRYYPSCSDYAIDALEKHGAIRGTMMSMIRVLRCNGYFKGGADPVK